jgi:hypothetical protein
LLTTAAKSTELTSCVQIPLTRHLDRHRRRRLIESETFFVRRCSEVTNVHGEPVGTCAIALAFVARLAPLRVSATSSSAIAGLLPNGFYGAIVSENRQTRNRPSR